METTTRDALGLLGTTIAGHYAIEAVVAEGSFSVVYRARHTLSDGRVAIKAIRGCEALPSGCAREAAARIRAGGSHPCRSVGAHDCDRAGARRDNPARAERRSGAMPGA